RQRPLQQGTPRGVASLDGDQARADERNSDLSKRVPPGSKHKRAALAPLDPRSFPSGCRPRTKNLARLHAKVLTKCTSRADSGQGDMFLKGRRSVTPGRLDSSVSCSPHGKEVSMRTS